MSVPCGVEEGGVSVPWGGEGGGGERGGGGGGRGECHGGQSREG